jgi:CubicO group peptidase (beta-lactamase class C family)
MHRFRTPLVLLLILICGLTWLPLHGIDDEPLVLTRENPGWSSAGVESSGIMISAAVSRNQTDLHLVSRPPAQRTPLAAERIWIVGLEDSRLLREVALAIARELKEVPGVREVAWFPRSAQPLMVRRTPDLWIVLELTHSTTFHLPGYCHVEATVHASMGRDPLGGQLNGPWREAVSTSRAVHGDSVAWGLVSAGARYGKIAQSITNSLHLHRTLDEVAQEEGLIPSPPLNRNLLTFDVPEVWAAALGKSSRVIQRGQPAGMAGEVLWEFSGDRKLLLERIKQLGFSSQPAFSPEDQEAFATEHETITLARRQGENRDDSLVLWRRELKPQALNRWLATSPAHERVGDALLRKNSWPGGAAKTVLRDAIAQGVFPGAVALMGGLDQPARIITMGQLGLDQASEPRASTLWDLASLTKVVSTTTLALILEEEGLISLTDPLSKYLPGFIGATPDDSPRRAVRLDHLLTHTSGLPPWKPLYKESSNYGELVGLAESEPLVSAPGQERAYSDLGLILLGAALESCTQSSLAVLEQERIFRPLGLTGATRKPLLHKRAQIAPTEERPEGGYYHGVVHDENARAANGLTAHAGLFATGIDMAAFCREWLRAARNETHDAPRILPASALKRVLDGAHGQCLGWQHAGEGYPGLGPRTLHHTGFTGTALWIDPDQNLFLILLTNRVHPSREGQGNAAARRDFVRAALQDARQH